jgi:hypothetical protein
VRAKWCPRCDKYLPAAAFSPFPGSSTGLSSWCRECAVAATREWRAANPEKIAAYNEARRLAYREAHPLLVRACSECGEEIVGRGRVTCGKRQCKDARWRRLNPEAYAAGERRKVERRRLKRQQARKR